MKIGDLFIRLAIKADTMQVKEFTRSIGDIPLAVAGAVTSLAGTSFGFMELTKGALDLSNQLGIFRSETGLSIEELQKWDAVAKQVGVSTDAVHSSVMGITQAMAANRTGHTDIGFLQALSQLGVNPNGKNAFQIMEAIMKNPRGFNNQNMAELIGRAHIDPSMMRLFSLSQNDFNRKASIGPTITESDQKALQDLQAALARFTITIEKDFVPILVQAIPVFDELAGTLSKVMHWVATTNFDPAASAQQMGINARKKIMSVFPAGGLGDRIYQTLDKVMGGQFAEVNVTQHIHSTADAHEVARISKQHLEHAHQHAQKQFNNSGY